MDDYTSYLAHHGIKGQKWGVRRYQNPDGSLTAAGRRRRGIESIRSNFKANAEKRKEEKRAKNAEEKQAELKEYLRKHPKKLPKYSSVLSQEDANEIIRNIEFDRKLADVKREEVRRGWQKIEDMNAHIKTVSSVTGTVIGAYNNAATVYNAIVDLKVRSGAAPGSMKKLPQAGWGNNQKQQPQDQQKK